MGKRLVVRMRGPLAPYASGFGLVLRSRGYAELSVAGQLRLLAHLSRWLAGEGLEAGALTPERIDAFCVVRRGEGYRGWRTARALAPLVEFLRDQGVVPSLETGGPVGGDRQLLELYRSYLLCERGFTERVCSRWVRAAALFLAEYPGVVDYGPEVGAGEVTAFCARELPRLGGSSARNLAAALRSFLRFLYLEGVVDAPLAQAVPPVAGRRGAGLPGGVPSATLSRLVVSCDRRTAVGRRDYAVLLLLSRLGLRAGEVAALRLDDVDWRAGDLVVHGKGGRDQRLPLPDDVGSAVAGYLRRGRPRAGTRTVFLRAIAPAVGLTPTGITSVVYAACDRAGVARFGAHRLRHSAATEMLRGGASLAEIAQVLRHVDLRTTAIYAKVDLAALRPLALPWPGGTA